MAAPIVTRILAKIDRNGPMHPRHPELGRCWVWQGAKDRDGYGLVHYAGSTRSVHRLVHALTYAEGWHGQDISICHSCDHTSCVNPLHLFAGSHADNMADCSAKGRHASQRGKSVRGERHGNATTPDAVVAEICRRVRAGETQAALAAEFSVSRQSVSRWIRGERRKVGANA